jgi:hypothetical protein
MSVRWEYKSLHLDSFELAETDGVLNAAGAEGWELCGIVQRERHGHSKDVLYILKRPTPTAE